MSNRHHSSGGASSESKLEKEKTRLIQEKCQAMLNEMLRDEDNKYCVDCDAKGPRWASWNLGIFLCIRCAGIHRNLGVHISKVKSVNLDTWTPEQVMTMAQLGNSRARAIYEANLPDTSRRPQTDTALESFIRSKYEHKKYIAKEYIPTPVEKPNWDQEIEEMLKKKKKGAAAGGGEIVLPPSNRFGASQKAKAAATTASTATSNVAKSKPSEETTKQTNQGNDAAAANGSATSTTTAPGGDLAGDLLGLTLDSVAPTGAVGAADGRPSDPFASPSKESQSQSAASDLFLLDSGAASAKLMSKESIMSLYGRGGGSGGIGMAPPPQQQQMGGLGQLGVGGGVSMGVGAVPSAGINSLAGLNLNPFLSPAPSAMGFPPQAPAQAYGGGFGVSQQAQVQPSQQQQQFMFNNAGLGGSSGLGLTSVQHQFQQFQQSTTPMMNQYTYPAAPTPTNPMAIPNPYQAMQMAPGPPTVPPAGGGGQFGLGLGRPAQQNFMFAQSASTVAAPLQSSPPNFLN